MILTVLRIGWLTLRRDRVVLALTFVLPILFFSVFAVVFGAMDPERPAPVRIAIVGPDDATARLAAALVGDEALELVPGAATNRADAERAIGAGRLGAAVVLDGGVPGTPTAIVPAAILVDASNPLAARLVEGAVQRALARVLLGAAAAPRSAGPFAIEIVDVLGGHDKAPSIAYFAAGIGVMFLLFAVTGRSAILIEERESGVLARMLASRLGLMRLLVGRWLHLTLLGAAQVSAMFVWGAVMFGLDLWAPRRLVGFAVMTAVTAAAAASLGLLLSAAVGTRARLNGVSVVLVLLMSAVGGSMFPRFLMPQALQDAGLCTFNAWALDGYRKVFWYDAAPPELWPQLTVLTTMGLAFFGVACVLARRWEA